MRSFLAMLLALAALPGGHAIEKEVAYKALSKLGELKSMTSQTVMCDECLEETDCVWPCEVMCVLDLPSNYVGEVCQICLEFYGCEGCKILCPSVTTDAPTKAPSVSPTLSPTLYPTDKPTETPTLEPTTGPTAYPTPYPTYKPTGAPKPVPTQKPTPQPSKAPTMPPTKKPTAAPIGPPTYFPTSGPTMAPVPAPTAKPTNRPTPKPTGTPTLRPSGYPSYAPSPSPTPYPGFYVYYSANDMDIYSYNPVTEKTAFLFSDTFEGDFKVDSENKLMFWSNPDDGWLRQLDLESGVISTVISGYDGIQGFDIDPLNGYIFWADQKNDVIMRSDYTGTNITSIVTLGASDDGAALKPFAVDATPMDTDDSGGSLFVTAAGSDNGYILEYDYSGNMLGTIYSTSTEKIFGIVVDQSHSMMYWVEDRGVANGVYAMFYSSGAYVDEFPDAMPEQFLDYQEDAYWLAAVWETGTIYVADRSRGEVWQLEIQRSTGALKRHSVIGAVENTLCVGYYLDTDSSYGSQFVDTDPDYNDQSPENGRSTESREQEQQEEEEEKEDEEASAEASKAADVNSGSSSSGHHSKKSHHSKKGKHSSSSSDSSTDDDSSTSKSHKKSHKSHKSHNNDIEDVATTTDEVDSDAEETVEENQAVEAEDAPPQDAPLGAPGTPGSDGEVPTLTDLENAEEPLENTLPEDQATSPVVSKLAKHGSVTGRGPEPGGYGDIIGDYPSPQGDKPQEGRGPLEAEALPEDEESDLSEKTLESSPSSSSVHSTLFYIGGAMVAVGLAAFVVYFRQRRQYDGYSPVGYTEPI